MKSFIEYLQESKQVGILYHYTSLEQALKIIDDDSLKTSKWNGEKDTAISFTRDKYFTKVARGLGKLLECRFVIDGNKLSTKYKITPYNWEHKYEVRHDPIYRESEERILDKDVTQLHKYIIRFEMFKSKDYRSYSWQVKKSFMSTLNLEDEKELVEFFQSKVPYEVKLIEAIDEKF